MKRLLTALILANSIEMIFHSPNPIQFLNRRSMAFVPLLFLAMIVLFSNLPSSLAQGNVFGDALKGAAVGKLSGGKASKGAMWGAGIGAVQRAGQANQRQYQTQPQYRTQQNIAPPTVDYRRPENRRKIDHLAYGDSIDFYKNPTEWDARANEDIRRIESRYGPEGGTSLRQRIAKLQSLRNNPR